jgi:hypothetical protein
VDKRTAKLLGGYETTIYPTVLGEMWRTTTMHGPMIKVLGPHGDGVIFATAREARDAAAALLEIADEIDGAQPP